VMSARMAPPVSDPDTARLDDRSHSARATGASTSPTTNAVAAERGSHGLSRGTKRGALGKRAPLFPRGVACYFSGMSADGRGRGAPTGRKIVSVASFASWWNFRAAPISRCVAVMAITSLRCKMACVPGHASWIARRGEAAMLLLWRLDGNPAITTRW